MESLASTTRSARSSTEAKRTGLVHSFHPSRVLNRSPYFGALRQRAGSSQLPVARRRTATPGTSRAACTTTQKAVRTQKPTPQIHVGDSDYRSLLAGYYYNPSTKMYWNPDSQLWYTQDESTGQFVQVAKADAAAAGPDAATAKEEAAPVSEAAKGVQVSAHSRPRGRR